MVYGWVNSQPDAGSGAIASYKEKYGDSGGVGYTTPRDILQIQSPVNSDNQRLAGARNGQK